MIDIQKWRKSKKVKHNKIYKKAKNIIDRGIEIESIQSEARVDELKKRFPSLDIKLIAGGNMSVVSIKDEWLVVNDGRFLALYHYGKLSTRRGKTKENYHIQDVFYDIEFLLASIVSHDQYDIRNEGFKIKEIKAMAFA